MKKYWKKARYFFATLLISVVCAVLFQPLLNDKALDVLVNIYSILAGFLIGVIALIGDPSSLPTGSWRAAENAVPNTFKKLESTQNLLYVYLLTLFLVFVYKLLVTPEGVSLLKSYVTDPEIALLLKKVKSLSEGFILFLSFVAFSYSFTLPHSLYNIQKKRVEREIESRREQAGIKPNKF